MPKRACLVVTFAHRKVNNFHTCLVHTFLHFSESRKIIDFLKNRQELASQNGHYWLYLAQLWLYLASFGLYLAIVWPHWPLFGLIGHRLASLAVPWPHWLYRGPLLAVPWPTTPYPMPYPYPMAMYPPPIPTRVPPPRAPTRWPYCTTLCRAEHRRRCSPGFFRFEDQDA